MRIWFPILAMLVAPATQAEMWKCVDYDGNTRYTNVKVEATGCKSLNLEPINTAPPPVVTARPQQKAPNFPSVDSSTQKQRDAGRRKILEQELALEQQELEAAKTQFNEQKGVRLGNEKNYSRVEERLKPYQDKVKLHEINIENLKKEIASVK